MNQPESPPPSSPTAAAPSEVHLDWEGPVGAGEMARRIREFDWAATPLGPLGTWPSALKHAVILCLESRFPMHVWWGSDLIYLYNDAQIAVMGQSHPAGLGRPARESWGDVWPVLQPQVDLVMQRGESTWNDRVQVVTRRNGFEEDTWFTWSYSPIRDASGRIEGLLAVAIEETERVRAEQERDRLKEQRLGKQPEVFAKNILESITDGFFALDHEWRFTFVNSQGEKILDRTPGDLLGQTIWDVYPGLYDGEFGATYRRCVTERIALSFTAFYPGYERWYEGRAYPAAEGISVYFRDVTARVNIERDLADTRLRLRAALEVGKITTWTLDLASSHILSDSNAGAFFNLPPDQGRGYPVTAYVEAIHPDDRARTIALLERSIATGEDFKAEYRIATFEPAKWAYGLARIEKDSAGKPIRLAGVVIDISERKRAEAEREKLLERERLTRADAERASRLYETVASNTPDLIYVFNLEHQFTYANRALLSMWGKTWEEAIGKNCLELGYEPWHAAMHDREIDEVVTHKRSIRGQVAFNGTQGRRFYDYIFVPVFGPGGEVEQVAGTTRDVTEQRKAGDDVRFLADLIQGLTQVEGEEEIIRTTVSAVGQHFQAHRCYFVECLERESLLRVSENWVRDDASDVKGSYSLLDFGGVEWWREYAKGDFAVDDTENHPLISQLAADRYAQLAVRSYCVQPVKRSGEWTVVLAVTEKHPRHWTRDELGLLENVAARVWPLVERARSEKAIRTARDEALAASRAKDDFLAALSHELRTPLNPVLLLASEAASDARLAEDVRADFETIARNVALEARLIDDLLDLTRITHDKLTLTLGTHDIHALLRLAIASVEPELQSKNLRLDSQFDVLAGEVEADDARLLQVFTNLLKNAAKFTPEGGTILVRTETLPARPDGLTVRIRDSGIGLTREEQEKIFRPFVQGEHGANKAGSPFGGLGLGLAISKKIVELHGGSIVAESPGRGEGATFVVTMPLKKRAPCRPDTVPASEFPAPERTRGHLFRRVLLVEDHAPSRLALAKLLAKRQIEVTPAATVAEALELAARGPFDLVISDIGLPDGNGYDLMTTLKVRHGFRGVALSGYGMEDDVARSQQAGFLAHLTKPVQARAVDQLLSELERPGKGHGVNFDQSR